MADEYEEIELERVPLGTVLTYPVYHRGSVLLLAEGTVITPRVVALLTTRGIERVKMHVEDIKRYPSEEEQYAARIEPPGRYYRTIEPPAAERDRRGESTHFRTVASRRMDEEIAEQIELRRTPGSGRVFVRPRPITDLLEWRGRVVEQDRADADLVERSQAMLRAAVQRGRFDAPNLFRFAEGQLHHLGSAAEVACFVPRPPPANPYPGLHALLAMRLGMAVTAGLGWSREEVLGVGIGLFCHDAGMLRLPDRLYRTRARMDTLQRHDLIKHPIFSLELVANETELHEYVRYVVYQAHERLCGSGYPRARTAATIHPAARVAGLVDSYLARVSERPHRNPLLPHQAILEILQETHQGMWDAAAVRSLIKVLSIYPLGSFVELADGRLGRSIQSNESDQRRPVLEVWDDPAAIAHEPGVLLDLSHDPKAQVSRPLFAPQRV